MEKEKSFQFSFAEGKFPGEVPCFLLINPLA